MTPKKERERLTKLIIEAVEEAKSSEVLSAPALNVIEHDRKMVFSNHPSGKCSVYSYIVSKLTGYPMIVGGVRLSGKDHVSPWTYEYNPEAARAQGIPEGMEFHAWVEHKRELIDLAAPELQSRAMDMIKTKWYRRDIPPIWGYKDLAKRYHLTYWPDLLAQEAFMRPGVQEILANYCDPILEVLKRRVKA